MSLGFGLRIEAGRQNLREVIEQHGRDEYNVHLISACGRITTIFLQHVFDSNQGLHKILTTRGGSVPLNQFPTFTVRFLITNQPFRLAPIQIGNKSFSVGKVRVAGEYQDIFIFCLCCN